MYELEQARDRLARVRGRIAAAAKLAGRDESTVELIAVAKSQPVEAILPLISAGQRSFGENRVQEARAKWPDLRAIHPDLRLHLVGQLQSNKAAEAVELFEAIHSVDRPSLLAALARAMSDANRYPACYVQVNVGNEPQKGGCAVADLPTLLTEAHRLGVSIKGLMCVPPDVIEAAPFFALLNKLSRDHRLGGLSMGMSGDFETAVMLGSTCVRIGTALFAGRDE